MEPTASESQVSLWTKCQGINRKQNVVEPEKLQR